MFVAIDIGNTAINIGYFRDHLLRGSFSVSTSDSLSSGRIEVISKESMEQRFGKEIDIKRVGISSVVPALTDKYVKAAEDCLKAETRLLSYDESLGFLIPYDDPGQMGSDRLANVIAARKLYGFPSMVIDLGTATKYEVIDKNGDYLGGLIAPGVGISASALFEKGARLFPVKLAKPERIIGRSTEEALQSGIYNGFLAQMNWLKERIGQQVGAFKVIGTGGYADLFGEEAGLFDVLDKELTLKGLEVALNE